MWNIQSAREDDDDISSQDVSCSELVTVTFLFALTFRGLDTDFLIILLQSSQIFTRLAEFALFHTFADIPMDEGTLRIHQVELVVNTREHFGDGRRIADHADCAHHLRQIASWHHGGWLVVDAALETGRAPINELDCSLRLDRRDR